MAFLTPLLLAGLCLVALPLLLHRIRRPERERVRFSSLMFVPGATREVIERRRVQHVPLMLIRMLTLALLALAFARPFERLFVASADAAADLAGDHVILVDVSSSMSTPDLFGAAQHEAKAAVAALPAASRVAVVAFGRTVSVGLPLMDPETGAAGAPEAARWAIDALSPTWESTDFVQALQTAERMLLAASDDATTPQVVHLVSDLQATGLPRVPLAWRLASTIRLQTRRVGDQRENAAVEDVAARPAGDRLQVRSRIRNRADDARTLTVRLLADGRELASRVVRVPPGNATHVAFEVKRPVGALAGRVTLENDLHSDDFPADDARFFAWNPEARRAVLVLRRGWEDAPLLRAAVPDLPGVPWRIVEVEGPGLAAAISSSAPAAVVAGGLYGLDPGAADALGHYVEEGGSLLLLLTPDADPGRLNRLLGEDPPLRIDGPSEPGADAVDPRPLTWVDLDHPVFHPFRAPQYNDFSALRFAGFHRLTVLRPDSVEVLARFGESSSGDAGWPAMATLRTGAGRVMVWAAGVDRGWSALSRDARFVPLLHETLRYLAGAAPGDAAFRVGKRQVQPMLRQPLPPGPWELGAVDLLALSTGGQAEFTPRELTAGGQESFRIPGIYRWRPTGAPRWHRLEAVNLDAREGNLWPLSETELQLRVAGGEEPVSAAGQVGGASPALDDRSVRVEYGRDLLVLVIVVLGVEGIVARRIAS